MNHDSSSAVLVTTHRTNPETLANLAYLAACSRADLPVYIGDNSALATKHEQLLALARSFPHVHLLLYPTNVGAFQNFLNLLEASKPHPLLAFATDDDRVSLTYIDRGFSDLRADASVSRSAGLMIRVQSDGRVEVDPKASLAKSPSARIAEYFNPNSFNTIYYSVFRRADISPWLAFRHQHPLPGIFFDFLVTLSTLAAGKFVRHSEGHHLYHSENWDQPQVNHNSIAASYLSLGLPAEFSFFHDFHFAVECLNFFLGRNSPVREKEEALRCADIAWSRCFSRYVATHVASEQVFEALIKRDPVISVGMQKLISQGRVSVEEVLSLFLLILSVFSSDLCERYRKYLRDTYS